MTLGMTKKVLAGAKLYVTVNLIKDALDVSDENLAALVAGRSHLSQAQAYSLEQLTGRTVGQLALDIVIREADSGKVRLNRSQIAAAEKLLSGFKLPKCQPSARNVARTARRGVG